jgi:PmbA protein
MAKTAAGAAPQAPSRRPATDILSDLISRVKKLGADAADAIFVEGISLSTTWRMGKLEDVERAEGHDLGLRVFVGKRQATVSATDLSERSLGPLPERALAMARLAPEDPYCGLAPRELLATSFPQIDIDDDFEPSTERLIGLSRTAEESALAIKGITNSEGGSAGWGRSRVTLVTSEGFAQTYGGSSSSVSCSVLAGSGTGMERDYDFTSARYFADLGSAEDVGRNAAERALKRLNPRKMKSCAVPVIFDPRDSMSLIGHFAGAINGISVARGTSFLKDKMGEQIFRRGIRIVDDPHRKRGMRSKPFDGEGVANKKMNLIDNGVLQTWLLDTAAARQLKLTSTGHASRGTGGPPSPSTTNLYMEPGALTPKELIADIAQGFYVTELIGYGVNGVTGDYSRGAAGFWIENGEITYPVSEITIAGNLKDMFRNLTPANDLVFKYGTNAPTLRVEGMTVAGA